MSNSFHLSIVVPDLSLFKKFYMDILKCKQVKDMETWIDFDFFGHQLTVHQEFENNKSKSIDHFGVILSKEVWTHLLNSLKSQSVDFYLEPLLKNKNSDEEKGKFMIKDPADNVLEFKYKI